MKRWILLLGVLLVGVSGLHAAEPVGGGYGGYYLGAGFQGLQALNDHLANIGLQLNSPLFIQGGGGFGYGGRFLFGGFGYGGHATASSGGTTVDLSTGGGAFEMGPWWAIGPARLALLGLLGGYGYTLTLKPDLPDVDFDSLLVEPRRMAQLTTGGVLLGVGTLAFVPVTSYLALGIHATLAFVPLGDWQLADGARVHNAPAPSRWHASVQVMILFGGEGHRPPK